VSPSKHGTVHYNPRSSFPYYYLTTLHPEGIPYPEIYRGHSDDLGTVTNTQYNNLSIFNVKLKIPAGIKSGQVLRLRGKGMQELNRNHFGDQLVRVNIETPKKVSKKAKSLMEELSKELNDDVNFEKFS